MQQYMYVCLIENFGYNLNKYVGKFKERTEKNEMYVEKRKNRYQTHKSFTCAIRKIRTYDIYTHTDLPQCISQCSHEAHESFS